MDTTEQTKELLEEIKKELDPRRPGLNHWRPDHKGTTWNLGKGFSRYEESAAMRLQKYIAIAQELCQKNPKLPSLKDVIDATYASDMGIQNALQLFQVWCLESIKLQKKKHRKRGKREELVQEAIDKLSEGISTVLKITPTFISREIEKLHEDEPKMTIHNIINTNAYREMAGLPKKSSRK